MPALRTRSSRLAAAQDQEGPTAAPAQGHKAEELADDVERLLRSLGENASFVSIYRENDRKPQQWDWIARTSADEFAREGMEFLRDQWGGGAYKLIVTDHTLGALKPFYVSIDARFKGKKWEDEREERAPRRNDGETFEREMLRLLFAATVARQNAPAPVPVPVPATPTLDPLNFALQIIQATKGQATAPTSVGEILNATKELMAFAQDMAPSGGNDDDVATTAIKALVPVAGQLVENMRIERTRPVMLPASIPNPPPPSSPPPPPLPPTTTVTDANSWLAPLKNYVGTLLTAADTDGNPATWADLCVDELRAAPDLYARVTESLKSGSLERDVIAFAPAFGGTPVRVNWLREFIEEIKASVRQLEEDEAEQLREATREAKATSNGNGSAVKPAAKRGRGK